MYSEKKGNWWKLWNTISNLTPAGRATKLFKEGSEGIKENAPGSTADEIIRKIRYEESYDQEQERIERDKYFQDYGIDPLYPYMAGARGGEHNQALAMLQGTGTGNIPIKMLYGGSKL